MMEVLKWKFSTIISKNKMKISNWKEFLNNYENQYQLLTIFLFIFYSLIDT